LYNRRFPEPFTFGKRLASFLQKNAHNYDLVHDNQSLCSGLLKLQAQNIPVVSTIHHPITKDLELALENEPEWGIRLLIRRWHNFLKMQKKVAPQLQRIITVSRSSRNDLISDFSLNPDNIDVVYNGVDHVTFSPQPNVKKDPGRIMATASADVPLKGLLYLLKALAMLDSEFPDLKLVVLGKPKKEGTTSRLIQQLGIGEKVSFIKGISSRELAQEYAKSCLAVVPSLYEGFGLPAAEAMSCGIPLVSTTGGALSEVVGDAGLLVPPGDPESLASAIRKLLKDPNLQESLGWAGRQRILQHFTWHNAAAGTANIYEQVIESKQGSYDRTQTGSLQHVSKSGQKAQTGS
ncbi:MAG: glycosyltransferase family 4 protein, partial [Thermodesulfobacteriota bacterium]